MRKYYYVCPRCGRTWVRYFPHQKMTCPFCQESWHTRGHKGTRSEFSLKATLVWLLGIVVVAYAAASLMGVDVKVALANLLGYRKAVQRTLDSPNLDGGSPEPVVAHPYRAPGDPAEPETDADENARNETL